MKSMFVSLEGEQGLHQNDTTGPVPVDGWDFYIQSHKGFNYHLIDLNTVKWSSLGNIIKGCEAVENECWKAQEEFSAYLRKCDVLSYAEKDGRIVAFDAVTLLNSGPYCVYNNEETMVLKAFRGRDLAQRLVIMTVEWHLTKTASMKKKNYFIFTSISANPAVVNRYFNKSWLRRLFDSSFAPSPRLIALKEEYCRKYGIEVVDKRYPFCLKNMFPGSNGFDPSDLKYQFSSHVRANMPPDFEHMVRGDAFAFMLMIPMKIVRWVAFILMIKCFGAEYFSNRGVGLFSRKRPLIPSTLDERIPGLPGETFSTIRQVDKMSKLQNVYLKIFCVFICLWAFMITTQAWACDVAVVSGKVTTDGKPLIWKNFDNSSSANQQVAYFPAKKSGPGGYTMVYRFEDGMKLLTGSAITPSGGVNESGFAIAGTSVYQDYNLLAEPLNINTVLMEEALATCTTLAEFESLLKRWPYSHFGTVISANFVVIDAKGGAALYECFTGHLNTGRNRMRFRKNDANTGKITNQYGWTLKRAQSNFIGFHIMTNYNTYIPWNVGKDRKYRAEALLTKLVTEKRINHRTVMREVAKDVIGKQVQTDLSSETNYSTTYCLSRNATRSAIVVRGASSGDDPRLVTMWCNLGEPSVGVFVPFFTAAGGTSELARMDTYINGRWYDYDDSCLLNLAIAERETYDSLIYSSNKGDVIWGMYDNYINKVELAKVQQWTFPIEDEIMDTTGLFLFFLECNPAQITAANMKDFADYCADYAYENFVSGSADAYPWQY